MHDQNPTARLDPRPQRPTPPLPEPIPLEFAVRFLTPFDRIVNDAHLEPTPSDRSTNANRPDPAPLARNPPVVDRLAGSIELYRRPLLELVRRSKDRLVL